MGFNLTPEVEREGIALRPGFLFVRKYRKEHGMSGKIKFTLALVLAIGATSNSLWALILTNPSCQVETYATYSPGEWNTPWGMTFDSTGNLYVTHKNAGEIYRIDPAKNATQFVTGLDSPVSITWGGGTPYGDNLYVADVNDDTWGHIMKITPQGQTSIFCSPNNQPVSVEIDRVGNYGGYLYAGTGGQDHIDSITPTGSIQTFTDFPYNMGGGGPEGIAFDPGDRYGGMMYVANQSSTSSWAGLYTLDTDGNPTHFAPDLITTHDLVFDPMGMFGHDLYILGMDSDDTFCSLYQADLAGQISLFASSSWHVRDAIFGADGALYISEFDTFNHEVIISKVTPEPTALTLLALGAFGLIRRRRTTC